MEPTFALRNKNQFISKLDKENQAASHFSNARTFIEVCHVNTKNSACFKLGFLSYNMNILLFCSRKVSEKIIETIEPFIIKTHRKIYK